MQRFKPLGEKEMNLLALMIHNEALGKKKASIGLAQLCMKKPSQGDEKPQSEMQRLINKGCYLHKKGQS